MKKFLALIPLFFIVAGFLFTSSVFAQATLTPVNTPTITAPAPYQPDINLPGDLDFECLPTPEKPIGWMTTTPSSSWELLCGDCYLDELPTSTAQPTDTPLPQPTWNGTGTPEATWTPSPTNTPTMMPSSTPTVSTCNEHPITFLSITIDPDMFTYTQVLMNTLACVNVNAVTIHCTGQIDTYRLAYGSDWYFWRLNIQEQLLEQSVYLYNNSNAAGGHWDTTNGTLDQYGLSVGNTFVGTCPPLTRQSDADWMSCAVNNYSYQFITRMQVAYRYGNSIDHYDFVISTDPSCMDVSPTATPTVTPVATGTPDFSYCSVVSDTSMDDSLFSYSGIVSHGVPSCFDLGPSEGFDFWGLGTEKLFEYPWLAHVCLQDIDIGVLTIFGVSLSLHIVAYVVGIAMIVRNMFVS